MLIDTPLADAVIANLELDPRIPESLEIAVAADDGIVTLRGTVESFSQRRAAAQDAKNVDGVYDVDNQLKVSLSGAHRRDDDEIRGAALQSLMWDVEVHSTACSSSAVFPTPASPRSTSTPLCPARASSSSRSTHRALVVAAEEHRPPGS